MKSNYKRLGDYIREVNVRNRDLNVTNLVGLSMKKEFRKSTSNVVGTDMSTYKVVKPTQFACDFMSPIRVNKLPVVLSTELESVIVSPAYGVFEIIDTNILLPEYLMMWFRRSEFDRYVTFKCDSAIRGGYGWNELFDTMIIIPSLEKQKMIVSEYNVLVDRIKLNASLCDTLEQTAQALYRKWFVDDIDPENLPQGWRMGKLSDTGLIITGKTPSSNTPKHFGSEIQFVTPGDFVTKMKFIIKTTRHLSTEGSFALKNKLLRKGDVLVTCIGSDMGKVRIANQQCITNQQINAIAVKEYYYSDYLYFTLTVISSNLKSMALGSSTMPMLSKSDFEKITLLIPNTELLVRFNGLMKPINEVTTFYLLEMQILKHMQSLLLSKLTKN